jgi:hypothetical protein
MMGIISMSMTLHGTVLSLMSTHIVIERFCMLTPTFLIYTIGTSTRMPKLQHSPSTNCRQFHGVLEGDSYTVKLRFM